MINQNWSLPYLMKLQFWSEYRPACFLLL